MSIAFDCQRYNKLPVAGGILDQPLQLWTEIKQALAMYQAFKLKKSADNAAKFNDSHPEIVAYCWEIEEFLRAIDP